MKCRRTRYLLLDFVDGHGNEALHAEVDRHLAECTECERFAAETKHSLALLRRVPVELLDENFNWKVRLAIHREEKANAKRVALGGAWVRTWNVRYAASAGVAFSLALLAGIAVLRDFGSPSSTTGPVVDRTAAVTQPTSRNEFTQSRPTRSGSPVVSVSDGRFPASARMARPSVRGAIDPFAQEGAVDSLIDARLVGMTPEMRARFIQRQIHRLQSQLENQSAPKP
jgi:anti-sigma factor RsiW